MIPISGMNPITFIFYTFSLGSATYQSILEMLQKNWWDNHTFTINGHKLKPVYHLMKAIKKNSVYETKNYSFFERVLIIFIQPIQVSLLLIVISISTYTPLWTKKSVHSFSNFSWFSNFSLTGGWLRSCHKNRKKLFYIKGGVNYDQK